MRLDSSRAGLIFIFLLALAVRALTALPLEGPGYFDAYYYYDVAENLHGGRGFVVDFIWNYLDDPPTVTHPSNLYWMPLPSILAYLSFVLLGSTYRASQVPFILLSALPPLLAYYLSLRLFGKVRYGLMAGLLTIFSGFYLAYWVSPDNFTPFAVSASLALLLMAQGVSRPAYFGLSGLCIGLSHLARADGVLLWAVLIFVLIADLKRKDDQGGPWRKREALISLALALGGYLLVMAPWFWRNWQVAGTPLPGAGTKTIFLRSYDDIFSYSKRLDWANYLAWGWRAILASKLRAAVHNLLVILGGLQFYLAPFAFLGLWQIRGRREYRPFFIYAPLLYLLMTLAFTFPSMRGSTLHSSAALLPFFLAVTPVGIEEAVKFVARWRRTWHLPTALAFFQAGFTFLALLISLFLYSQSLFFSTSPEPIMPLWNERDTIYLQVAQGLEEDVPVMVVDPPAYYYFTHGPALAIPNEDIEVVLEAAHRYGARYLILERDHPAPLNDLYEGEVSHPSLNLLRTLTDPLGYAVQIYRLGEGP